MASRAELVTLPGMINDRGWEVPCMVAAKKVSLPGPSGLPVAIQYCGFSIKTVSQALPDGEYELFMNGQRLPMRLYGGKWLLTSLN
jgi:hypothetical protein